MEPHAVLILDKPEGITSQGAVSRIKRLFGVKKAGHTGTLDPMATGVLPILLGGATKAGEYMLSSEKHYIATLTLGLTTDTEDITGRVLSTATTLPSAQEVEAAAAGFLGEGLQVPPMFSALKVGGEKLYELARRGIAVERQPRPICIHRLEVTPLSERDYRLEVVCSKGTYIRTLCADIGAALSVGGVMSSLRRAEAGGFSLTEAVPLSALEAMSDAQRQACLLPVERIFASYPAVTLPPFFARLAKNGLPIYQKKLGTSLPQGTGVRMMDREGFFAYGEVELCEDGIAIRPKKQFPRGEE